MGKSKDSVKRAGMFLIFSRHTKPIVETVRKGDDWLHVVSDVLKTDGRTVWSAFYEVGGTFENPGRIYRAGHMLPGAEVALVVASRFEK